MNRLINILVWLGIALCCTFLSFALAYPALAKPVCVEKHSVYQLALADKEGNGLDVWDKLVANGECADITIPLDYIRTLTIFHADEEETRIVEWLHRGEFLYGLLVGPPPSLTLIKTTRKP